MQNGQRRDPLRVEAKDAIGGQGIERRAAFIFLHGYGDDAEGFVSESTPMFAPLCLDCSVVPLLGFMLRWLFFKDKRERARVLAFFCAS